MKTAPAFLSSFRKINPDGDALASGGTSSIFFEFREAVGDVALLRELAELLMPPAVAHTMFMNCDYLTAHAGMVPFATVCADVARRAGCAVQGVLVHDGERYRGAARFGGRVLIVTDVVTTGNTVIEQARRLEKAGHEVVGCVALVDRRRETGDYIDCEGPRVRFAAVARSEDFYE